MLTDLLPQVSDIYKENAAIRHVRRSIRKSMTSTAVREEERSKQVRITFLEVYNEKVYDLLTPSRTQCPTRPDHAGGEKYQVDIRRFVIFKMCGLKNFQT